MSSAWIRWLSGRLPAAAAASGWLTLRRDGWTWQVAAELQVSVATALSGPLAPVFGGEGRGEGASARETLLTRIAAGFCDGEVLKQTASRTVKRWTVADREYYAKTFQAAGFAERLRELLRGPHARWEASRIALATAHGVPTAAVVAVGWNHDRIRSPDSVLVTRGLPDVLPLSRLRTRYEVPGDAASVADRHGLIDAVADVLARLHGRGLVHGDLHAGNVVVRHDADGWRAWLIDLAALRAPFGGVSDAAKFENLARIDYSMLFTASDAERRRFFRRYWSQRSCGSTRQQALASFQRARQRFIDRVGPQVDSAWSRGHRKVIAIPGGVGLASLGREWLTELATKISELWEHASSADGVPCLQLWASMSSERHMEKTRACPKLQAWHPNHRLVHRETPLGLRTLRVIRFPASSTTTARATWDATHAALRRGIVAVVPWLCMETTDASYLVCCQPDDAVLVPGTDLLTTPDGRWTGIAVVEHLVQPVKPNLLRRVAAVWLAVALMMLSGCGWLNRKPATGLPDRHTVKAEQLVVQSDIRLPKNHPLIKDLDTLRQEIATTLKLPLQEQPVTVYLFADELRYAQYLQVAFPNLPPRRAYFVGTPDELAVYTFWGEKIQEDLRHEYTHGVLHASLKDVPLWLDEGLAEYFEVTSQPRGLNGEYVTRLADALNNGWQPDMRRLEQMDSVSQMQKGDYLEAWAWVHFLLHDGDAGRDVLLGYLNELRDTAQPGRLSDRLTAALPAADDRFRAYAATLKPDVQAAGRTTRGQTSE